MVDGNEIGKGCPFTRPWPEVWKCVAPGKGWDTDDFTKSMFALVLNVVNRPTVPVHLRGRESVGKDARYRMDPATHRYGYLDSNGSHRPILTYNPHHAVIVHFMEKTFTGTVFPDENTTWLGFVGRSGSGIGAGEDDSAGSEVIAGVIYNFGAMLDTGFEPVYFNALIERTSTIGADALTGFNFVYVTGLKNSDKFEGTKFSGTDINIAFVVSASILKNATKIPKYAAIAEKMLSGAKVLESWEKTEFLTLSQRAAGIATAEVGGDIQISLIDIGLSSGAALSKVDWTGTIANVSRGSSE